MYKILLPICIYFSVPLGFFSQNNQCLQPFHEQKYLENNPGLEPFINQKKQDLELKYSQDLSSKAAGVVYTIPVVFHILHLNGPENISNDQVHNAMEILNQDFSKTNPDITNVISQFAGIAGDAEIEFKLAQIDPQGDCTNGINRYETPLTNDAGENSKINIWPRNKYLNIWVVNNIEGSGGGITLGYTFTPGLASFQPTKDGIMIWNQAVGLDGVGTASTDGKTLSHEIGHWINLAHTWGNSNNPGEANNCSTDDGVNDTPNCIGNASGCNTNSTTCNSLDNVQNFMNYASCVHMFTDDQITRMRSALTSNTAQRSNLWTPANLIATGLNGDDELCFADFSVQSDVICTHDTFFVYDQSYHGATSWTWSASGANLAYYNENGQIIFENEGFSDVTLNVSNATTALSVTKENIVRVVSNQGIAAPFTENFENQVIPSLIWDLTDVNEDGITWDNITGPGFDGGSCVWINNFDNQSENAIDVLTSPLFDLANMSFATVQFKVAYARKVTGDQDRLKVFYSKDCGKNWIQKFNRFGNALAQGNSDQTSAFTPSGNGSWKNFSFTLNDSELSQNGIFKIEFNSDFGNNIYFDDFTIDGTYSNEIVLANPSNNSLLQEYSVKLDWKAPFTPVDAYEYQFDDNPLFSSANAQQGTKNYISYNHYNSDTEYDVVGTLAKNVTYYWRVRGITSGNAGPWSDRWSFMINPTLSIDNHFSSNNRFTLFPNPTSDMVSILFDVHDGHLFSLAVYDVLGKKIKTLFVNKNLHQIGNTYSFNSRNFQEGIYFIELSSPNGSSIQKLIVKK